MQIKRGGGGFTLAELLIVMAIIVVLAAIAIPTFGRQLETARETGDMEIIRAAYTEALSMAVLDASDGKLDAKNGETTLMTLGTAVAANAVPTASATNYIEAVGITDQTDKQVRYVATFAKMEPTASIKQVTKGWQYVNKRMAGVDVPDVVVTKGTADADKGTEAVAFNFEIDANNNVHLLSTNGIVFNAPAAGG